MPNSRHKREPGTPPRSIVMAAALALAAATGVAVWLLPARATPETPVAAPAAKPPPPTVTATPRPLAAEGPSAFLAFVDTARTPEFNLPDHSRRTGVRWYALGHVVSGGEGCVPKWGGKLDPGSNPVANRIGRLRAGGADAGLSFGGPAGRELADACDGTTSLTAAYRRVVSAFGARFADFEIRDSANADVVLRRARALRALQQERPLHLTFTFPLGPGGLSERDTALLKLTHDAGARISTVNLLAAIEPRDAPEGRMRRVAEAVRAAHGQIARTLGIADPAQAWRSVALTSVLVSADDLGEIDARKLTTFAARYELAWLSLRGAAPSQSVSRILWRTRA
ncbi:hypothetical protein [Nonomuraea endophytica]|uniref:Chitinase n=1 Tax=Nonomuraea endophytica TaxID=714136 RepID=A0A7W8EJE9_9ACTN|nr:hypothetical protein [Nonomuraea endophytica]MBB5083080.1 hypothetical protein [Nonomuraea endophytica]